MATFKENRGKLGISKVAMMKNGILLIRFNTEEGKEEVLDEGIYHLNSKPLIVRAWTPKMDFSKDELWFVPIWIKMSGLEFKYWSTKSLSKISSRQAFDGG